MPSQMGLALFDEVKRSLSVPKFRTEDDCILVGQVLYQSYRERGALSL